MSPGYVYVLAFTNGTVKVGRTQDTNQRLNAHKSDARKFGLTVTDQWLSPPHAEWRENEETLKKVAAGLGGTAHSKEYFSGVSFEAIAERARELPFTAAEDLAERVARERTSRLADIRARARRAEDEARALRYQCTRETLVNELLDAGIRVTTVRRWGMADRAHPSRVHLDVADAMEARLREEAALGAATVERQLESA